MPVYLLHGFRWPRPLIRIHIILQNLDDAAAEWLVAPGTTLTLLKNFNEIYPECMEHLNRLRFVEQYDPNDASSGAGSQPYAYVADMCEEITLGVDVDDVRGKGVPSDQWAAMMELRDKLAPEEKVAWYIVVCGDEDRWAPGTADSLTRGSSTGIVSQGGSSESDSNGAQSSTVSACPRAFAVGQADDECQGNRQSGNETQSSPEEPQPKGLRKFFASALGRRRRSVEIRLCTLN